MSMGVRGNCRSSLYIGLIITLEELFSELQKIGLVIGWTGRGSDLGFGAGQ